MCAVHIIVGKSCAGSFAASLPFFPALKQMFPDLKTERGQPLAFDFGILWEMEHEACAESFASAVTVFSCFKQMFSNLKTERGITFGFWILQGCMYNCTMRAL